MNKAIACLKFFLFFLLTVPVIPLQLLILLLHKGKGAYIIPFLWQRSVCAIFRIKVECIGAPNTNTQTIFISNHISYLDIPAIGSILRASFVAKKEVASWPVFGLLSKLQQTAFISRDRADAALGKHALDTMLDDGKNLIIFAEGTSTDGREVLPFKSSLFSIAMKENLKNIYIQPITLKMERINNKDVNTQEDRDLYSWHNNMDTPLAKHLWLFALSSGAKISINLHPPIKAHNYSDRKTLAKACHLTVSNGLNN